MPNLRFLQTAKKWMNDSLPAERQKPGETNSTNLRLTQILQRDEDGKPKLDLTPIEKTAVNTPTQEDYDGLMRVYECGGWRWVGGDLPTKYDRWEMGEERTSIDAENGFAYDSKEFYQENGWNVISPQEFYQTQKVTPEMLNEINIWFDENGK